MAMQQENAGLRGERGRLGRRSGRRAVRALWEAVLPCLLVACGGNDVVAPDPNVRTDAELLFLRPAPNAPPLLTTDTTLLATRGQDFRLRIFYAPAPESGSEEGDLFLELEIDKESLLRYPAGHPKAGQPFQAGDTVAIRVSVDPRTLIATLEPTGLEFDPDQPAELEMRYGNADDDFDGDGTPDPEDEGRIDLWRQERPGEPWVRIGNIKDLELDRVRAFLRGFSRFAMAI